MRASPQCRAVRKTLFELAKEPEETGLIGETREIVGRDWEPQRLIDGMLKTSSTTPV